jgi:signal transduction histidine kinase
LLDNAIKFTDVGGITLTASAEFAPGNDSRCNLIAQVSDTGPGVPEGDRERVIERFVRLDNSRTEAGSGLGLYLSGLIAKRLGGDLRYRPDETHVRFELWLPI